MLGCISAMAPAAISADPVASIAVQGAFLAVLGVGGVRVASGTVSVGDLVAFVLLLFLLVQPLAQGISAFAAIQTGLGALARIEEVLDLIGLTERGNDRTDRYSGGMQRRLNIGIGLLHQPRLLLLDEPTVGVDPQSRNAILESIAIPALPRAAMDWTLRPKPS